MRPSRSTSPGHEGRPWAHRVATAYAAEVRAVQTLYLVTLLLVGGAFLLVVRPWLHLTRSVQAMEATLAAVEDRRRQAAVEQKLAHGAAEALAAAQREIAEGQAALRRKIERLVDQGQAADPQDRYGALVTLRPDAGGSGNGDRMPVREAVRREIGRHAEGVALAAEQALAAILTRSDLSPMLRTVLEEAQTVVGRESVALNEALGATFARDPEFWRRWPDGPVPYAGVSPQVDAVARRIDAALRTAQRRLARAAAAAANLERQQRERHDALRARRDQLAAQLRALQEGTPWAPLGAHDAARLYPLLAGMLTVTLYYRLRRAVALRAALDGVDPDLLAPSWLLGGGRMPGRWWTAVLLSAPLALVVYAAALLLADPAGFAAPEGEPSPIVRLGYGALYGALSVAGAVQWVAVVRKGGEGTWGEGTARPPDPGQAPNAASRAS